MNKMFEEFEKWHAETGGDYGQWVEFKMRESLIETGKRLERFFWGLPISGYAENGLTAYPKQWFSNGNI